MTDHTNETPAAELQALARQIDAQLSDEAADGREIAAQASARVAEIAHWLRGGARPGRDLDGEESRLKQAREYIEQARERDLQDLPASVLARLAAELLRHASWLLAIVDDDPDLLTSLRIRDADKQAELTAALVAEIPGHDVFETHVAADLARFEDSRAEIVTRWLQRAREAGRAAGLHAQRQIMEEAVTAAVRAYFTELGFTPETVRVLTEDLGWTPGGPGDSQ